MAQHRKIGLGKGLGALLNDTEEVQSLDKRTERNAGASLGSTNEIPLHQIQVNPYQPRTEFDEEALEDLAESIKLQGLIQPITVRRMGASTYQLISGERRLRASKMAGLKEVPAYVRTANDQQMLEMALIENIQRENLNAIEVALSFQRMINECRLKQEELGERVSKNRSTVNNYLRLLKLPPSIQASIRDGQVSMGHARALVALGDVEKQLLIHRAILKEGLSVRKVEDLVRNLQSETADKSKGKRAEKSKSFAYQKVEDELGSKFSTKVKLNMGNKKDAGKIEIPFHSEDDLNRILELLDW